MQENVKTQAQSQIEALQTVDDNLGRDARYT